VLRQFNVESTTTPEIPDWAAGGCAPEVQPGGRRKLPDTIVQDEIGRRVEAVSSVPAPLSLALSPPRTTHLSCARVHIILTLYRISCPPPSNQRQCWQGKKQHCRVLWQMYSRRLVLPPHPRQRLAGGAASPLCRAPQLRKQRSSRTRKRRASALGRHHLKPSQPQQQRQQ
jgi:hypothetical protein